MSVEQTSTEIEDAELDKQIIAFLRNHLRALVKAPMIGVMAGFSAMMVSESLYKTIIVGVACMLLAALNTWRRYLEPLVFWFFVAAMIYWCDHEIVSHLKMTALSISR